MGGCRCTYRNCTVKSDRKTHMFHYPVFEKIRCHQWLVNAHRLDFLDLKVSQLKNRVVCQHHFKDENFMNFKKDKLTFDAIPTEDGPYCDTSNYVHVNPDSSKLFAVIIDDIENDYNDKKANYSLKYGDFLANLELMDIEKIDNDIVSYKNTYNNNVDFLSPNKERSKGGIFSDDNSFLYNISLPDKSDKKSVTHPTLAVSPYIGGTDVNNVKQSLKPTPNSINISNTTHHIIVGNSSNNNGNVIPIQQQELQKKQPKIQIISEKKVTDPVPITGKFELVTPNFVLNVSKKKSILHNSPNSICKPIENKEICNKDKDKIIEIEIAPCVKEEPQEKAEQQLSSSFNLPQNSFVLETSPKVSVIKPRVPPERVEAINKKREFNMKLRDMVENCLHKLDNCNKTKEQSKPPKNMTTKINKRKVKQIKSIPKNTSILNPQEYTIAFLEARMRKMENTLLEKIEQNSMKIMDLKNLFVTTSSEKQLVTQSKIDEEIHKKKLFQEIEKYLSPSSKSLIYEELFINKFALSEPATSPKRKRRRR